MYLTEVPLLLLGFILDIALFHFSGNFSHIMIGYESSFAVLVSYVDKRK